MPKRRRVQLDFTEKYSNVYDAQRAEIAVLKDDKSRLKRENAELTKTVENLRQQISKLNSEKTSQAEEFSKIVESYSGVETIEQVIHRRTKEMEKELKKEKSLRRKAELKISGLETTNSQLQFYKSICPQIGIDSKNNDRNLKFKLEAVNKALDHENIQLHKSVDQHKKNLKEKDNKIAEIEARLTKSSLKVTDLKEKNKSLSAENIDLRERARIMKLIWSGCYNRQRRRKEKSRSPPKLQSKIVDNILTRKLERNNRIDLTKRKEISNGNSNVFSDGFDENCLGNSSDREYLDGLTEDEKAQVIYNRKRRREDAIMTKKIARNVLQWWRMTKLAKKLKNHPNQICFLNRKNCHNNSMPQICDDLDNNDIEERIKLSRNIWKKF